VARKEKDLSFSEKLLVEEGKKHDVEVVCSKDGQVFEGDLDQFDAFAFYTFGNLTKPDGKHEGTPMSAKGKQNLLDAVAGGKGFVGFHSAADTFHSKGKGNENQTELDPYVTMLGGEFVTHGSQQKAKMQAVSPKFPGCDGLGDGFEVNEEWYALKNFAKDLHVILVQETKGMKTTGGDACYDRPPFPATWARMHGKGRVFYTSFGHRDDIWTNLLVQAIVAGGIAWAMGNVKVDVAPNIDQVAPKARQLKY
jgi:type 1 glutamine amidotransferase